jgi:hypothetical protein
MYWWDILCLYDQKTHIFIQCGMAGLPNLHILIVPLSGMACSKSGIGDLFEGLGIYQKGSDTRIAGVHDGNTTVAYMRCNGCNAPTSYMRALLIATSRTGNDERSLRQTRKRQGEC